MLNGAHFRASGNAARVGTRLPFDPYEAADDVIPAINELKARDQWVGWKLVMRAGARKPAKPPVNPHNGFAASHSNPSTWGSHKQATAAVKRYGLAGVGYVLSDDDDYTGIDIDKCRGAETGKIEDWAQEVLALAETYAEISPSGTGVRMFVRGKIDKAIKSDVARVEIYGAQRYLTITGNHVEGTPLDIREAPKTLTALIARVEAVAPKREEPAEPARSRSTGSAPRAREGVTAGERAWAAKALEGKAADLAATVEGGRNHALNAAAYGMGTMVARGWIDEASVRAALENACRQNGLWRDDGPFGVRATLKSGLESGRMKPHPDLPEREDSPEDQDALRLGEAIAAGLIARAESRRERVFVDGDEIDPETGEIIHEATSANDDTASAAVEPPHAEEARGQEERAQKGVEIETVNAASLAGKPVPRQEWLVQDMIPKNNVTMLAGDGATGKSLLGLQLAVAVATGGCWIGFRPEIGRALFLSAEDELDEVHRRLVCMAPRLEILDNLDIIPLAGKDAVLAAPDGGNGLLKETPLFKAIRHIIAKHRPDLLILDTLADLFGGDEIKKVQARQFIAMLRGLALDFGVTVLLLSHPSQSGMNSGSGMSGNTAWNNSVRSRLYFERRVVNNNNQRSIEDDVNIRVLKTMKSNRAAIGGQIVVRYDKGMFVREEASTLNARDAAHQADNVFLSLLAQFDREGRTVSDMPGPNYAPKIFSEHADANGVTKLAIKRAMDRLFKAGRIKVEVSGPPSKQRRMVVAVTPNAGSEAPSSEFEQQDDFGADESEWLPENHSLG